MNDINQLKLENTKLRLQNTLMRWEVAAWRARTKHDAMLERCSVNAKLAADALKARDAALKQLGASQ